jgi:hypothetical protein
MTNTCNAIGAFSKMAVQGGAGPRVFSATSERYPFINEYIKPAHEWKGQDRNVGDLELVDSGGFLDSTLYAGRILIDGSRYNIEKWLPRAMTSTQSSSPWNVGGDQDGNEFDILIDRENGVFHYKDCVVASATIFSDATRDITISLIAINILAKDCVLTTPWPSPEPAIDNSDSSIPYVHHELDFSINSVSIPVSQVVTTVANKILPIANSSVTAQKFRSMGRTVTCSVTGALTGTTLSESELALNSSPSAILLYSNPVLGDVRLDFENFMNIGHTHPTVEGRASIPLILQLQAGRENTTSPALTLTTTP